METAVKQKLGMALSLIGGALLLGFNWADTSIVFIGVILLIVVW